MGDLVVCFFLVEAYDHAIFLVDFTGVDHESGEVCLVFYAVLLHKACLVWVNKVGGNGGQVVGKDAGEDFVVSVEDGDGAVVTYLSLIALLVDGAHPAF